MIIVYTINALYTAAIIYLGVKVFVEAGRWAAKEWRDTQWED